LSRIIIAAQNVLGAGAKVIAQSLLPALCRELAGHAVLVLLPDTREYRALDLGTVQRRYFRVSASGIRNDLARLWQLHMTLPRLIGTYGADIWLTLADLGPITSACRHVIFLHQPLLVYDRRELNGSGGWGRLKRRFMISHFGRSARRAHCVVVQTSVMAQRVQRRYAVPEERIAIVAQPVPRTAERVDPPASLAGASARFKLLFLAQYYPHKNHSILPAVCAELRKRGLAGQVHFFLTLDADEAAVVAHRLIRECAGMATNLGVLSRPQVYAALRHAAALFLPTLVESYGLIYLEAMACRTPILTSERDFSRRMCGDLAVYFDPLDAISIADAIERLVQSGASRLDEAAVAENLSKFPSDWPDVASRFVRHML
jgi:glycosyltransferase involved in cell wall biosynthesis